MKKLSYFLVSLLFLGLTACEQSGNTPLPPEAQKFVGDWNFSALYEGTYQVTISKEILAKAGFDMSSVILSFKKDGTFQLAGIPSKNINGTCTLEGEELVCQLSAASYESLKKQFTSDHFKAIYSQKEGKEKIELVLGKLIITEAPIDLNNVSLFFEK